MRALVAGSILHRSLMALATWGLVASVSLACGPVATAGDDLGIRRTEFWPWPDGSTLSLPMPVVSAPRPHRARRIWAASRVRPLRIALDRRRSRVGTALRPARVSPVPQARVVFARRLPREQTRPALVSIYQDGTLRRGDAVMMADGIHVFHGTGAWPLRSRDFVRLPLAASLDWHLRQSLDGLDRNPPTRWTSMEATSG